MSFSLAFKSPTFSWIIFEHPLSPVKLFTLRYQTKTTNMATPSTSLGTGDTTTTQGSVVDSQNDSLAPPPPIEQTPSNREDGTYAYSSPKPTTDFFAYSSIADQVGRASTVVLVVGCPRLGPAPPLGPVNSFINYNLILE